MFNEPNFERREKYPRQGAGHVIHHKIFSKIWKWFSLTPVCWDFIVLIVFLTLNTYRFCYWPEIWPQWNMQKYKFTLIISIQVCLLRNKSMGQTSFCNRNEQSQASAEIKFFYLSVLEMLLITSRSDEKRSMARHNSVTAPVDTNWGKISSSPAAFRRAPVSWNKAWLVCSGMQDPSSRCNSKQTMYQLWVWSRDYEQWTRRDILYL
jgi:hypothetical protein